MTHQLVFAARSDRGLIRSSNQDSVYAGNTLLVVADGMGGHAAGDMASRLVVPSFLPLDHREPGGDLLRALAKATRDGNAAIAKVVHDNPELDGMGTTVTALLFDGGRLALGARRRLPGVPIPGRRAAPADPRRHLRAVADRRRADHPGGGRPPPAAVAAAARPERHRRRPVADHPRGHASATAT